MADVAGDAGDASVADVAGEAGVACVHVSDAAVAGHSDVPGMNGRCGWLHGVFAY